MAVIGVSAVFVQEVLEALVQSLNCTVALLLPDPTRNPSQVSRQIGLRLCMVHMEGTMHQPDLVHKMREPAKLWKLGLWSRASSPMCLPCPGIECLLDALEFNPNADELNDAINECRQAPLNTVRCLAPGLVTRSHVLRAPVTFDGPDHAGAAGA